MLLGTAAPRVFATFALASRASPRPLGMLPAMARARTICASIELPPHLEDMKEELASGEAQLFDVREPNEAASGMLADAQLVPLSGLQQGMKLPDSVDRTKLTYVHCAAGIRVHYAAPILEQSGFERVVPLQEGFATLYQLGFPLKE